MILPMKHRQEEDLQDLVVNDKKFHNINTHFNILLFFSFLSHLSIEWKRAFFTLLVVRVVPILVVIHRVDKKILSSPSSTCSFLLLMLILCWPCSISNGGSGGKMTMMIKQVYSTKQFVAVVVATVVDMDDDHLFGVVVLILQYK